MAMVSRPNAALEFRDDDVTSDAEESDRDSFDVDEARESEDGDVDAERESYAVHVLQERMSQILTESLASLGPPRRRRMTEPPQQYKLQREEILVEPLAIARLCFPTTERFEKGVKLSRRATYTPSTASTQFFSSRSLPGIGSGNGLYSSRSSLTSHPISHDSPKDKLGYDHLEEPETEPETDQRWTMSLPPSRPHDSEWAPTTNHPYHEDAPSMAKTSRRRRFSSALRRLFK